MPRMCATWRYSHAFAANDVGRKYGLEVGRAQMRHRALGHGEFASGGGE